MTPKVSTDFLEPPGSEDEIGRLGPYRVLDVLGKGGMGYVYRAVDSRLKRTVALKVMNKRFATTPHSRKRFVDEARSMAAVHHDNVAMIFEVGQKNGTPFLAMELLRGETLEAAIASGHQFTVDEVLAVAEQTASGLMAAHRRGITHRDIKPANLWMQAPTKRIKILDFGLAIAGSGIDRLSRVGSVVGTPGYLSPEQARSDPVDDRTDLYALGVVLYQLASGQLPLSSKSMASHLVTIVCHEPVSLLEHVPALPEPLSALIMKLLAKEPRDRFATAAELLDAIAIVRRDIASTEQQQLDIDVDPSVPAVSRSRRSNHRSRAADGARSSSRSTLRWMAAAVVGLLCLSLVGYAVWRPPTVASKTTDTVVAGPSGSTTLVKKESLQPLHLIGEILGDAEVLQGSAAQFRLQMTNSAVSVQADPRRVHRSADLVAQIVPVVREPGRPERAIPGSARRLSPGQLPSPGETKSMTIPLSTADLATGTMEVVFELQTPAGDRVDSRSTRLSIHENLVTANLIGFDTVRTFAGRGADTSVRRGSDNELGKLKGLKAHRGEDQREHIVLRFDLSKTSNGNEHLPSDVDRAVLLMTVSTYGHQGSSELRAYGWSDEFESEETITSVTWTESGEQRLTWDNCPIQNDPGPLTYLGIMRFDNSRNSLVRQTDAVRLASDLLDDFVRAQTSRTVTIVLIRDSWNREATRMVSREGNPVQAPGLAIRWKQ
ncbi:MAG: serine/threonine-protein kinase [Planctomycetota bacterium]